MEYLWTGGKFEEGARQARVFVSPTSQSLALQGFKYYVEAEDADILILTETKVNNDPLDPVLSKQYPHRYWSISAKKTYCTCYFSVAVSASR